MDKIKLENIRGDKYIAKLTSITCTAENYSAVIILNDSIETTITLPYRNNIFKDLKGAITEYMWHQLYENVPLRNIFDFARYLLAPELKFEFYIVHYSEQFLCETGLSTGKLIVDNEEENINKGGDK